MYNRSKSPKLYIDISFIKISNFPFVRDDPASFDDIPLYTVGRFCGNRYATSCLQDFDKVISNR